LPEPNSLSTTERNVCTLSLCLGGLVLAAALWIGFGKGGNAVLIFTLFALDIALFAVPLVLLLKVRARRTGNPNPVPEVNSGPEAQGKPEPGPDAPAQRLPDAQPEPLPESKAAPKSAVRAGPESEVIAKPKPQARSESLPETKLQPKPGAQAADASLLMRTTIGEILLAAIAKDPDGAQRVLTQALTNSQRLATTPVEVAAKATPDAS
jgi:hypothetical protein